jgi:hypothetical protein
METFKLEKIKLKKEIHEQSISIFHISFDLWTAPNTIPLIAVVIHYTDSSFRNCTKFIAFRRLHGSHSGKNMATLLVQILKEFEIEERLGYFITDNATSNDLCIDFTLEDLLPDLTSAERKYRRLRYYGHVLNLACMTYFYGHDAESFEIEHMVNNILQREVEDLKLWRKLGPLGKLHNITVWIRRNDWRRTLFLSFSKAGEPGAALMLKQDNSTRWNSVYDSIKRAFEKQGAVQALLIHATYPLKKDSAKQIDAEDVLTAEDWRVLAEILHILKPFKGQTMRLQSRAVEDHHGSL